MGSVAEDNAMLNSALNYFRCPIIICDSHGQILYSNNSFDNLCDKIKNEINKGFFSEYKEMLEGLEPGVPIKIQLVINNKDLTLQVYSFLENEEVRFFISMLFKKNRDVVDKIAFDFIAKDPVTLDLLNLVKKIAKVDSSVLITGETGAGKEVIANLIHKLSSRSKEKFVKINCTTLPENLLESELFGYEKGAFTGAAKEGKKGLLEISNHGTLLLDEIGDMPLSIQVKLLRFLQENEIYKLGGTNPIKLDVRILAATNKNLPELIKEGKFREDLYYRLNVVPIYVPPLRERPSDIPALIDYFLAKYNGKYWLSKKLSPNVRKLLTNYQWPGNIRELQNLIERLIVTTDGDLIDIINLPNTYLTESNLLSLDFEIVSLQDARTIFERNYIMKALNKYKSIRRTAKVLGVDHSTILRKLKSK